MWWIILLGSLVTLIILVANSQKKPGSDLKNKFASLGNMKGMKYQEIAKVVGECSSRSPLDAGELCQWIVPGFHIALEFDDDQRCVKLNTETFNEE